MTVNHLYCLNFPPKSVSKLPGESIQSRMCSGLDREVYTNGVRCGPPYRRGAVPASEGNRPPPGHLPAPRRLTRSAAVWVRLGVHGIPLVSDKP